MGCAHSGEQKGSPQQSSCCPFNSQNRAIKKAMPHWAIPHPVLNKRISDNVAATWLALKNGQTQPFLAAKEKDPSLTPITFFYNTFYKLFFTVCPEAKPMFKRGMRSQGKMFANILNFVVTSCKEAEHPHFQQALTHLAITHNQKGVTAMQYSIMGECLLSSLSECCGPDIFDREVERDWLMVFSKMMEIIIPIVISGQTETNQAQQAEYDVIVHRRSNSTSRSRSQSRTSFLSSLFRSRKKEEKGLLEEYDKNLANNNYVNKPYVQPRDSINYTSPLGGQSRRLSNTAELGYATPSVSAVQGRQPPHFALGGKTQPQQQQRPVVQHTVEHEKELQKALVRQRQRSEGYNRRAVELTATDRESKQSSLETEDRHSSSYDNENTDEKTASTEDSHGDRATVNHLQTPRTFTRTFDEERSRNERSINEEEEEEVSSNRCAAQTVTRVSAIHVHEEMEGSVIDKSISPKGDGLKSQRWSSSTEAKMKSPHSSQQLLTQRNSSTANSSKCPFPHHVLSSSSPSMQSPAMSPGVSPGASPRTSPGVSPGISPVVSPAVSPRSACKPQQQQKDKRKARVTFEDDIHIEMTDQQKSPQPQKEMEEEKQQH